MKFNNVRIGKQISDPSVRCTWILKYYNQFRRSVAKIKKDPSTLQETLKRNQLKWSNPPEGFIKLNVDAAWKSNPASTGLSAILKDWKGNLLGVSAWSMDLDFDPPLAEIFAVCEGLKTVSR